MGILGGYERPGSLFPSLFRGICGIDDIDPFGGCKKTLSKREKERLITETTRGSENVT